MRVRILFSGFACLACLSAAAIALGQANRPPTEGLENYDDPPALFFQTGVSPARSSVYNGFISRQVNVNSSGQNITGDAANEPSITVDPTNHNRMAIGWRQFDSVTSNFRQAGYGYTADGGLSWVFPGVLEPNVFRSDPVLFADDIGRFFYLSLIQTFFDNVWRSVDSGRTYTNLGPATGGDKQWFVIDNTNSTGHGFQYQAWSTAGNNYGGRQFSRSTDGGVTWIDPVNIPNSPQWGTLDVDSAGNLFIGGINVSTSQFWCIRSTNAKNAAATPSFDQSTAVNLGGRIVSSVAINPAGLSGQLFLAVDRSGSATNNNVYMLATVRPTGATNGTDIMFTRSTNGGQTFSAPRRLNNDPVNQNKWHWMGALSVAPNGRIDAVWLDTRNAANNTDSQLFYSYSTDGGNTWSPNIAASASFNPFLGYPNQNKIGDYMTIVSDNTGADVAYAATFNLEEDIYYVRIAPPRNKLLDFDGDTKTDVSIFRRSSGQWWYLRSSDGSSRAFQFGQDTDRLVPADYTGDGKSDVAFWRPPSGEWFILRSEDSTFYSFQFGELTDGAVPADFDGDGKADPAVFRPTSGTWYVLNSSGGTTIQPFGTIGDRPVPADYDGDGKADIAIFRPSDGSWWLNRSRDGLAVLNFGSGTDKALPGDYTGDGKADAAFFRPSTNEWFILRSENFSFYSLPFGTAGDIAAPGDYDGDGKIDPTIFRPSNNTWYKLQSTNGFEAITFGAAGDIPVPGVFVR